MSIPAQLLLTEYVLDGEQAVVMEQRAIAVKWSSALRAIELAKAQPWTQLGVDSRVTGAAAVKLAESSVVAELASRFTVSEDTVRNYAATARTLQERLPRVWARFAEGFVPEQNATVAARLALELPQESWAVFDRELVEVTVLNPVKFRVKARGLRERLHPTTAETRHAVAREDRRVWIEPDRDGMAWFGAYLPVDVAHKGKARIDRLAFGLARLPGETRTMAQLRADVFSDILAGEQVVKTKISLALTIPALSLLGQKCTDPGRDGQGPDRVR